jgi:hypothetical protein
VRRFLRTIVFIGVFGLSFWLRQRIHLHFHLGHHASPTGHGRAGAAGKAGHLRTTGAASPQFEWIVVWIAVGLGVVGLAAVFYLQRKLRPPAPVQPGVTEDVAATIGDAIDGLESEADARRAVIAAYARMERVLGRHGMERRPSETPLEYLRRVLHDLTSNGDAVERLTALFERAKFSSHEVTGVMKADAIDALREIRAGIAT